MHVATRRVLPLAVCAVLLASRPSIAAETDAALQHPLARSRLSLVDAAKPSRRRVAFNARFTPRATMDNPAFAGATLRIYGSAPTDGDSGLIELKAAKWHPLGNAGSKGYRYEDETG